MCTVDPTTCSRKSKSGYTGYYKGQYAPLDTPRYRAVALRTLSDPEDAADALQDALLSAHRAAATYRGDAQVTTWLHRIVVNACLDRMRRSKARPTVPLPEHDSAHPVEPSDPLGRRELAWEIDRALRTLPAEQRAALVLVWDHERTDSPR